MGLRFRVQCIMSGCDMLNLNHRGTLSATLGCGPVREGPSMHPLYTPTALRKSATTI